MMEDLKLNVVELYELNSTLLELRDIATELHRLADILENIKKSGKINTRYWRREVEPLVVQANDKLITIEVYIEGITESFDKKS
jgi:hypothetical protein